MTTKAKTIDSTDTQILELIQDTRLQQVLILHLEGKSAKEISDEVGTTVAKNALSLLSVGRGKLNQVAHDILANAVNTHIKEGMSVTMAIAHVADEFGITYLTVQKAHKKFGKES